MLGKKLLAVGVLLASNLFANEAEQQVPAPVSEPKVVAKKATDPVAAKSKALAKVDDPVAAKVQEGKKKAPPYVIRVGGKEILTVHEDGSMLYYDKPITQTNELLMAFYDIVISNDKDRTRCYERLEIYREIFFTAQKAKQESQKQ